MKDPIKSRDVVPKNVPGVGWGHEIHIHDGVGDSGVR